MPRRHTEEFATEPSLAGIESPLGVDFRPRAATKPLRYLSNSSWASPLPESEASDGRFAHAIGSTVGPRGKKVHPRSNALHSALLDQIRPLSSTRSSRQRRWCCPNDRGNEPDASMSAAWPNAVNPQLWVETTAIGSVPIVAVPE